MSYFTLFIIVGGLFTSAAFAQSTAKLSEQQSTSKKTAAQHINITMTPSTVQPSPAQQQELRENLKDVRFAFDRYDLDDQAKQTLQENANWLKANPGVTVSIAGNADERGDITYNLALSHNRAQAVRDILVSMGVPAEQIEFATGWGKLYPVCAQAEESCWARNRRAHLTAGTSLQNDVLALDQLTPAILACATKDCR